MHIKNNLNIQDFINKLSLCHDLVTYETSEGDCLVLTSVLSQYIFGTIVASPELAEQGKIICKDERDYDVLSEFLIK